MAGYFKKVLTPWDTQLPSLVEVHGDYAHLLSSVRQWNIPAVVPAECIRRGLDGFTKTGTIDVAASSAGIGVKGDGSTGLYSRTVSVVPQAMWMAVQFTVNSVTTVQKTVYALGSAGVTTAAYCGIFSGNGTTSEITIQFRAVDATGPAISKVALTPVVGTTYTVIAVYPSGLNADAYVYVNGIKYTADLGSSADISFVGANTLVNEAVDALKRGAIGTYGSDTVLFTARGLGNIPESLAKQISLNPYSLLQPDEQQVWVPTGGSTGVGSAAFSFTSSAIGASLFNGAGSCSFSFANTGVGSSLYAGVGSSSISFTPVGYSASISASIGAAAITFNAAGYAGGSTLMPAVGNVTMSFTSKGYGNALKSYTWDNITYGSSTWTDIQPPTNIWTDIITPL